MKLLIGILILVLVGCCGCSGDGDGKDVGQAVTTQGSKEAALGGVTITAPVDCDITISGPNISSARKSIVTFDQVEPGVYLIKLYSNKPNKPNSVELGVGIRIDGSDLIVPVGESRVFEYPTGTPYCTLVVIWAEQADTKAND